LAQPHVLNDDGGDQVSGDDKKNIDTDEPALEVDNLQVKEDDKHYRKCAQTIDFKAVHGARVRSQFRAYSTSAHPQCSTDGPVYCLLSFFSENVALQR